MHERGDVTPEDQHRQQEEEQRHREAPELIVRHDQFRVPRPQYDHVNFERDEDRQVRQPVLLDEARHEQPDPQHRHDAEHDVGDTVEIPARLRRSRAAGEHPVEIVRERAGDVEPEHPPRKPVPGQDRDGHDADDAKPGQRVGDAARGLPVHDGPAPVRIPAPYANTCAR